MRDRVFLLTFLLLSLGSLAPLASFRPPEALPSPEQRPEPLVEKPRLVIEFHGNRLSVQAHHAPWDQVLQEITRCAGVKVRVEGHLPGTLTQVFEALPLDQGLRRLFRQANLVLLYTQGTGEGIGAEPLTSVWLFPKEGSTVEKPDTQGSLPKAEKPKAENLIPREEERRTAPEVLADEAQDAPFTTLEASARNGDEETLRKALFDPDEITQERALELLAARDPHAVIGTLLDATRSDQPETRLQALHLLHETRYAKETVVLSALVTAVADADVTVQGYAIQALAQRGGPGALEALRQALRDPAPTVRKLVIGSIVQYDQGLPLLQEALSDEDETVRSLAAWKLAQGVSKGKGGGQERR